MMRANAIRRPLVRYAASAASAGWTHDITTIDVVPQKTEVFDPETVAVYMLSSTPPEHLAARERPRVAFVDNFSSHGFQHLRDALHERGFRWDDVTHLLVTHAHLDHAAGTSNLLSYCPNATVLCDVNAVKHLVDPKALIASARRVYGEASFGSHVGNMGPIDASRVRAVLDGSEVLLAPGRPLLFLHVEGHAKHHIAIFDPSTESCFTGDACGICYEALPASGPPPSSAARAGSFFPVTTPIDFDCREYMKAVERVFALPALKRVFPTHFGGHENLADARAQMLELLPRYEEVRAGLEQRLRAGEKSEEVLLASARESLRKIFFEHWVSRGYKGAFAEVEWGVYATDIEINAGGLLVAAGRSLRAAKL